MWICDYAYNTFVDMLNNYNILIYIYIYIDTIYIYGIQNTHPLWVSSELPFCIIFDLDCTYTKNKNKLLHEQIHKSHTKTHVYYAYCIIYIQLYKINR